jgi:NADH-quinone oxidoreductase subunit J
VGLDLWVFWIFAPISVASGIAMLLQRNAVHAALFLIANFLCLAVFYLVLGAELLFVVQIAVYAGAIMVLFLFVINLLGVDRQLSLTEHIRFQRPLAVLAGIGVATEIVVAIRAGIGFARSAPGGFAAVNQGGNPKALGTLLFHSYFLPFEVTSILLTVASVAAVILAQRPREVPSSGGDAADGQPAADGRPAATGARTAESAVETHEPVA